MSHLQPRLDVFDKIPKDEIMKLGEFFDESIILTEPDNSKIREIVGDDFRDDDIEKIKFVFFDFVIGKTDPERIFEMINRSQLGDEIKTSLKEMIKELYTKISSDKLNLNLQSRNLRTLGHPHIHKLKITSEFRPFSKSGKILKFIPSLIMTGSIHGFDVDKEEAINIQLDLSSAQELVNELKDEIKTLNEQISDIRDKFGENIID